MGDHDKQPDLHQFDRWGADQQFKQEKSAMDGNQCAAPSLNKPGGGCRVSDFESHDLNDMIDMVKSAKPEDLENAANGFWDARDAIWAAADELLGHISRIDWQGEAANSFHNWASDLVNHSYELGFFADTVGTQVSAASMGLASVSNSMPPRDTRPKGLTIAEQVKLDPQGITARAVERNRQEAINQMNRLASYYAVSEENLRGQDGPTFGKMPDMGVPRVSTTSVTGDGVGGQPVSLAHGSGTRQAHEYSVSAPAGPGAAGSDPGTKLHHVAPPSDQRVHLDPSQHVGTNIDSANTLPPDTVKPTAPVTPSTAPTPGGGGPIPPVPTGPVMPTVGMPVGRAGAGGTRGPFSPSRMAVPAVEEPGVGTGTGRGPVGGVRQPVVPGQTGARGPVSPMGRTPVGQSPVGRAPVGQGPVGRSIVGGTPRSVGTPGERPGGTGPTGTARTGGVVGGRPTTPSAKGATGSRVPRGTVIGGEPAARDPHAVERPGQRGVIRAAEPEGGEGQASRRPVTPGGAIGASNSKAPAARSGARASDEHVPGRLAARRSTRDRDDKKSRRRQAPETE
ncbi:hypothetical protein FRZ03_32660 [Streptomyces misionensis]|uniref:PPE family protein n=1 Tax=Streptomyces misionensis TaxID=67331 RepID=A0A5C6IU79_9ACTN|nr:hypothetical protein [Streptomyces misionensis]TWV32461.1 hypothetical protein FRZ03_32660 [Streptomyces misionensis]